MAVSPKPASLLPDLYAWTASLPSETPYHQLAGLAREAGWVIRLRQADVQPSATGGAIITLDVLVSRMVDGQLAPFELLDKVTGVTPASVGPASLAVRAGMEQTLLYLFFGRLPPPPVAGAQTQVVEDRDTVFEDRTPTHAEYIDDNPPLRLVATRTPDGVPILIDLYSLNESRTEIIDAVIDLVEAELPKFTSPEQLTAFGTKNQQMMTFIKDLGQLDEDDVNVDAKRLVALIRRREGQLKAGIADIPPHRRMRSGA